MGQKDPKLSKIMLLKIGLGGDGERGGGGSERVCICFPFCKAYNLDCGHVQFLGQGGESRAGCVHTDSTSGCTGVQIAI